MKILYELCGVVMKLVRKNVTIGIETDKKYYADLYECGECGCVILIVTNTELHSPEPPEYDFYEKSSVTTNFLT